MPAKQIICKIWIALTVEVWVEVSLVLHSIRSKTKVEVPSSDKLKLKMNVRNILFNDEILGAHLPMQY